MSFTLTVWAQPDDQPLPADVMEAQGQLDAVWCRPGPAPDPRFLALARALDRRFPPGDDDDEGEVYDHGLAILETKPGNDRAANIGLWARDERFDESFNHLVVQANDLGLHVMDGQNGAVYLANGNVLQLGDGKLSGRMPGGQVMPLGVASHTVRLDDALARKDWAAAWDQCRRLAPRRLPEALTIWGLLVSQGRQGAPHPALGAALAQLSGTDPARDKRVQWCLDKVPASQRSLQAQLLERLRQAGDLLAAVDAELRRSAAPGPAGSGAAGGGGVAVDKATAELARSLGVDPELGVRAAAGSSYAQFELARAFIQAPGPLTLARTRLIVQWLERAAAGGQTIAKAVLGDILLRGVAGLPVDMERGLALLEEAAAADDIDGLKYLADFLYLKSVRTLPNGDLQKLQDTRSWRYQARVPQLLMRAASLGSRGALFWLSVRLYDEIGTPRDDIAAKAVMQLALTHAKDLCAEQPGLVELLSPKADDAREVSALAQQLGADMKRLPELLGQRLAARAEAFAQAAKQRDAPARDSPPQRPRLRAGHLALLAGALGFVPLLMLAPMLGTGGIRALALLIGLIGAYGIWRSTADWDWGPLPRAVLSALALVPGLGFVACVFVLLRLVRTMR